METITWIDAKTTKPDSDQTVLCWGQEGFFCGYWDDAMKSWIGCESGGSIADSAITHWSDPEGPLAIIGDENRQRQLPLESELQTAAERAFGRLWMIEAERDPRSHEARQILADVLDMEARRRGIEAAIDAGHQADHPPGCDWWAGKPEDEDTP